MNLVQEVYQMTRENKKWLPLRQWNALGLSLLVVGIIESEHNWLSKVAERLWGFGKADSIERRLQRWLDNERIDMSKCCRAWSRWVLSSLVAGSRVVLLVDITKLGERLDVVMVGLAYRERCIPLAWRCLRGGQKWPCRQNDLIMELLEMVCVALPEGVIPLIQADRGLGTSPDLIRRITQHGWHYLFRIQNEVSIRMGDGRILALGKLVRPGSRWHGEAQVFRGAGWLRTYVTVLWRASMREAWCLVTNAPDVPGHWYAARNWQEQSFRDLKSGGWRWNLSHVRQPDHADRLLLALALAYAWMISLGTQAIRAGTPIRHLLCRGSARTYSVFRLGLRFYRYLLSSRRTLPFAFFFRPNLCHF